MFITRRNNAHIIKKGAAAVDYIESLPEPSGTNVAAQSESSENRAIASENVPSVAKKRRSLPVKENVPNWRKDYFEHFKTTDQTRCEAEVQISRLKQYNLVLRNMQLERDLNLSQQDIYTIRLSINADLNDLPAFTTEYVETSINLSDEGKKP